MLRHKYRMIYVTLMYRYILSTVGTHSALYSVHVNIVHLIYIPI